MRSRPVTPLLATDIVIELVDRPERPIVLVERKNLPHGWALPGGFVDVGEPIEAAAVREAREETGLDVGLRELLGVYSDPSRDPRGHIVSVVYVAVAIGEPHADDDARTARAIALSDLPGNLVFDHAQILSDYKKYRETGKTQWTGEPDPSTPPGAIMSFLRNQ